MARLLITGASGFLGHNLASCLAARHEVLAAYHRHIPENASAAAVAFDITRRGAVREQMSRLRPQLVVHAAALSRPDECELHPDRARAVNVEGTRHVAEACRDFGCRLVHISTDLVFDGLRGRYAEEDPVRAISVYADSKIAAEAAVREVLPSAVILRVGVLYGRGTEVYPGFVDSVLRTWRAGRVMTFFTDQYRTPTFAPQVAEIVDRVAAREDVSGLFHAGGGDRLSRYEFGVLLASLAGVRGDLVRPGRLSDAGETARRGADCSLVSAKIERALGVKLLSCFEGLQILRQQGHLALA